MNKGQADMASAAREEELGQLKWMRSASFLEGTTLVLLLGIAVPLKHLAGMATAVRIMGPVHGIAFVFYFYTLIQTLFGGEWSRSDSLRMILAAFIPFGAFFNERLLARHALALKASA
jgi:integral membrane protein